MSTTSTTLIKFGDSDFRRLCQLIYKHCGLDFDDRRRDFVANRVGKRLSHTACTDAHDYVTFIQRSDQTAEMQLLCESLTTNETYFFREYPQLASFADTILPEMCEAKRRRGDFTLNLWSAACSTGEEPYTLAIILAECLEDFSRWNIQINATDISQDVLRRARAATYEGRSLQYIPQPYLIKHFDRNGAVHTLRDSTRRMVRFDHVNFQDDAKMSRYTSMDFVFCRNVLIYFDKPVRRTVIERLHRAMLPGAFLFVGHSETLTDHLDFFEQVRHGGILQYRKRGD